MSILAVTFTGGAGRAIGSLTATTDSRVFTLTEDHADFADILALLKAGRMDEAEVRLDRALTVRNAVSASTKFTINGNVVTYNGRDLPNVMAQYIIRLSTEGFDLSPLEKFTENLFTNPSYRATQECFKFLEANEMPITEDGCFIAYRSVTLDYKDHRTGTWDNSIGAVCKEDRNLVDEDPNNTCSKGLHVCALGYIHGPNSHGYGGDRSHWVIVKVNPRDVVAVPHDYKNTKMRVCEFEVVGQLDKSKIAPNDRKAYVEKKAVYTPTKPAAKSTGPTDQELIAAGKFYQLGQKHRAANDARGSGDALTDASFSTSASYEAYLDGYEGRIRNSVLSTPAAGTKAAQARALFTAGKYNELFALKNAAKVSFARLGLTDAEVAVVMGTAPATSAAPVYTDSLGYVVPAKLVFDAHGYDQFGFRRSGKNRKGLTRGHLGFSKNPTNTATAAPAPVAAPAKSAQYNAGYADGQKATSFLPTSTGTDYWTGFTDAWAKNPNNTNKR